MEESALGFVPSRLTRYTNNTREGLRALPGASSYEDLHGWIAALNQFAKDEAAIERNMAVVVDFTLYNLLQG